MWFLALFLVPDLSMIGYVFGPREAALPEALLMASFGGFKIISVDYRMPRLPLSRRDG